MRTIDGSGYTFGVPLYIVMCIASNDAMCFQLLAPPHGRWARERESKFTHI